jgi:hypothetical protein
MSYPLDMMFIYCGFNGKAYVLVTYNGFVATKDFARRWK